MNLQENLRDCRLCPRECGVDREAGQKGYCGAGSRVRLYRSGPHHGEEPPVSGYAGSGTVFFSRCTLRCIYCQNYPWSQQAGGRVIGNGELGDIFANLADAGSHNINLVSPTPWLPMIEEAFGRGKSLPGGIPVVYNTSGYEKVETLGKIESFVDVYLTDLRYSDAGSAEEGSGASDYPAVARAAFKEMWRQKGALEVDSRGIARKGVICRLLVLPGREKEAIDNLRWLANEFDSRPAVSVMSQYMPAYKASDRDGWNRRVDPGAYGRVVDFFESCGFEQGWLQEFDDTPEELVGFNMKSGTE